MGTNSGALSGRECKQGAAKEKEEEKSAIIKQIRPLSEVSGPTRACCTPVYIVQPVSTLEFCFVYSAENVHGRFFASFLRNDGEFRGTST